MTKLPPLDTVTCADALDFLRMLPDESIDLVVTSPPYDNLRAYNGFTWDFEGIARETYRVMKPGGVVVWVVGDSTDNGNETLTSFRQALFFRDVVGFKLWDTMIWNKYLPGDYGKRYVQAFEYMFVLAKVEPNTFNPLTRPNRTAGSKGKGFQRFGGNTKNGAVSQNREWVVADEGLLENVWQVRQQEFDGFKHPARFPEKLAERHILTWSNPGDIVLDFFGGSGTTAKMARKHNRRYLTCDISAEYCELMRQRLAKPYTADMFSLVQS